MAALLFRVKPRHVEKFQKCPFPDVGKSELEKKKHAQNIRSTVHRRGDLISLLYETSYPVSEEMAPKSELYVR